MPKLIIFSSGLAADFRWKKSRMGCRGRAQSWTLQFLDTRATRASHLQAEVTNEIRLQGDIIYLRCPFYEMQKL